MKIILCKGQFLGPISGADETLVTYATLLRKAGHTVSVLLLYPHAPDDQFYLRLRGAGVPVSTVAPNSVGTSLGAGRRVARGLLRAFPSSRRLVRRNAQKIATGLAGRYFEDCRERLARSGADVAHVITPDPGAMVMIRAAHAAGVPALYQELGTPFHPPDFKSYYEQFTTVLPLCAEVAALSPLLARQCREKLPRGNALSVLPITAEDLRNGDGPPQKASGGVTVGFAARIEHLKGPAVLLEAFAAASKERDDLRLRIAGAGSLEQKLAARVEELGLASRCEFVGVYHRPEERKAFMQGLDLFAMPSLTEGTPNSVVEAMSHGLPVVATGVGGVPDVVTSEVGLLVPPNDAAALAGALLRLAGDAGLRARMGAAAARKYEQLFSPEVVLPVLLKTYGRVASARGGAVTYEENGCRHPWAETFYHGS